MNNENDASVAEWVLSNIGPLGMITCYKSEQIFGERHVMIVRSMLDSDGFRFFFFIQKQTKGR